MASNNNTSKEIQASQYYIHRSYVNTYYHVYKFLEQWIANNIFRQDSSRIFLASDGYAFRRRFELTDPSKDFNSIEFSSLNLPFANYWPQNNGWIVDPRLASRQAALTYIGIYESNTKIRAAQSLLTIPVTFWFDREDDARLAYEILYFRSFNEHYYSTKVPYGRDNTVDDSIGNSSLLLDLPVNIKINENIFNPEFKETDWLKKQRVFIVKTEFIVRSYAILPPSQPKYDVSLNPDGSLSDGSTYEDGFDYFYIVDDIITNFNQRNIVASTYNAGFDEFTQSYKGTTSFPEEGQSGNIYVDSYISNNFNTAPIDFYVWDDCNMKYVSPDYKTNYASIRYNGSYEENTLDITRFDCISKVTKTTNTMEWEYGEGTTSDDISSIEIHITGRGDFISVDSSAMSYKVTGLTSNSKYYGYINFISKTGLSKRFIINFTTKAAKSDTKESSNSLIGISW